MAEKLVATITVRDNGGGGAYKKPQRATMTLDTGLSVIGNYLDASDVLQKIVESYSCGFWTYRSDVMSHVQQVPSEHVWPTMADQPYLKADIKAVLTFNAQYSLGGVNTTNRIFRMELPCPKKTLFEDTPEGMRVTKAMGDAIATLLTNEMDGWISGAKVTFIEGWLKGKR